MAKVNDLASRQHLTLMEVGNFSLGNNFVSRQVNLYPCNQV